MESQDSFSEILLSLPLFLGLGRRDMDELLSKTKFHFLKFVVGNVICKETAPCKDILFVTKGELKVSHGSENNKVIFHEILKAPIDLGIENMFGISQYHMRTITAQTDVQMFTIAKEFVTGILLKYDVFRFNVLGLLCNRLQRADRILWTSPSEQLMRKFIQVCMRNFQRPYGSKIIQGKMVDLAIYVGSTRLNLSRLLNHLEENQLVILERKRIYIPRFEELVRYSQDHPDWE